MPLQKTHFDESSHQAAEKTLQAAIHAWNHPARSGGNAPRAFVTVSREPGAGGVTFSHRLAARLNAEDGADWSAWDRELVEKVSAEEGIEKHVIEMITQRPHNWLDELAQSFATSEHSHVIDELRAYKRVAMSIRALASAGHAILVGQGGVFITSGMRGGVHVRLVAPLQHRIKSWSGQFNVSQRQAAEQIVRADHNRNVFFSRYWPGKSLGPEAFTMTLNSGDLSVDELVECVLPAVLSRQSVAHAAAHA